MNFKHGISVLLTLFVALKISAQSPNNQAIVTIIGDPVQASVDENNAPPVQRKVINQTIEPTLENGFHMRFEVGSPQLVNHGGGTSSYSDSGYSKGKRHGASMTERGFNIKKRVKSWMPTHKKKYRPHLCGRF